MRSRATSLLPALSLALALLASALLLIVPSGSYVRVEQRIGTNGERGQVVVEQGRTTLLEEEGKGILVALAIPVAVAALPVVLARTRLARAARAVAAVLLLGFVFVTGFSIGLFYVPAALATVVAAFVRI